MFSISDDDDLDYLSGDFLDVPSPRNRHPKRSSFDLGLTDHNANLKKSCITELNSASLRGKIGGQKENSGGDDEQNGGFTLRPAPFLRSVTATTPSSLTANSFTGLAGTGTTCSRASKPKAPELIVSSTFSNKPCSSVSLVRDQFIVPVSESRNTTNDLDFGLDSDSDLDLSLVNAMVGAVEAVSEKNQERNSGGLTSGNSELSLNEPSVSKYSGNSTKNLPTSAKQSRESVECCVKSINSGLTSNMKEQSKSSLHGELEKTCSINLQQKSVMNSNIRAPSLNQGSRLTPRNAVIHNSQVPSTSKVNLQLATVSNKGQTSNKPPSLPSNNVGVINNQPCVVGGLRTPKNSIQPTVSRLVNTAASHSNESDAQGNLSKVLRTPSVKQNAPVVPSSSAGSCLRTPNVPVRLSSESERRISSTPNLQPDPARNVVRSSSFRLRTPDVPLRQNTDRRVVSTPGRGASNVQEQRTPSHQNPLFVRTKVSPPLTTSPCPREGRPEATTRYITPKCPAPGRIRTTDDETPRSREKRRKFPGPAGMLPKLAPGQDLDSVSINPFDSAAKIKEKSGQKTLAEDENQSSQMTQLPLGDDVWQCMKEDIGPEIYQFCRDFNIANIIVKSSSKQLPRGKVPVMCAMVDSVNVLAAEASVILKDTSGEIKATVHRQVVKEFQSELQAGCGLVLKQVGVFSPSVRKHYLNITPNNVVYIYTKKDAQLSCRNVSSVTVGEIEESLILDQEAERSRSATPGMPQTPVQSHSVGPNHMRTPVAVTCHTPNMREQSQNRNSIRTVNTPKSGLSTPTIASRGGVGVQGPSCPGGTRPKTPGMPQAAALQGQGMGHCHNSRTSIVSNPGLNTPTGAGRGSGQFRNSAHYTASASAGHLKQQNSTLTPRPGPSHAVPSGSGFGCAGTSSGLRANSHQGSPQLSNVSTQNRPSGVGPRTPITNQRLPNPGHMSQGPVNKNLGSSNPKGTQGNSRAPACPPVPNNAQRRNSDQSTRAATSASGDRTSAPEKTAGGKSDAVNWENESISDLLCGLEDEMMDDLEV